MLDPVVSGATAASLQRFEHALPVAPEQTLGGHVNFGTYLDHLVQAFHAWYVAMGIGPGRAMAGAPAMAHVELDYRGETFPPVLLRCVLTVTRVGRSSLEHRVEIFDTREPQAPKAVGRTVNVWREPDIGPAPWPAVVLDRCRPQA